MISPAFAGALAAVRPQLNRRIGEVRRATRGFDDGALTAFLHDAVDPLVLALADQHVARLPVVVLAAVEAALLLGVHDRGLTARTEQVRDAWRDLAAPCAALIAATPAQVALAWLLRRSSVMLPIPGTSSISHLEENCTAGGIVLDDAQFEAVGALA